MTSLTIRNIPDATMEKVRHLSLKERRSINNELLVLIDEAVNKHNKNQTKPDFSLPAELQTMIWKQLSGRWVDDRSAKEIIKDIYSHRTQGRKVEKNPPGKSRLGG